MKKIQNFTAIIERENEGYVGLCPEIDVAAKIGELQVRRLKDDLRCMMYDV